MTTDYKGRIGNIIRDARKHRGLTQQQLAELLSTSQSAINRIEKGHQNLSLEMLARIGAALDSEIVALGGEVLMGAEETPYGRLATAADPTGAVFKLVAEHFPGRTGSATGIVGAAGGLGGFFPPLVMGGVRQALGSYWPGFLLLGLMALLCLMLNQRLLRHRTASGHSEQARA